MKLTITNDRKEARPGKVYYVGMLFHNVVAMLHERGLLESFRLTTDAPTDGAELDIQPVSCSHCRLRKNCEFAFGSQCEDYERQPS